MSKTKQAFDRFRHTYPERECPPVGHEDERREMTSADGLEQWRDGTGEVAEGEPPMLMKNHPKLRLWVVRAEDVVHAPECGSFADTLNGKEIKHSNLTGARPAHCGGQLVFVENDAVALDGGSGRYGPRSKEEMTAVARAFKNSGYGVWSYGWDDENAWPFRIGSRLPQWVK
ncbi:hypothetical protein [Gluconacetobacter diazotrophicus]|uniref:hypothetical protein n=1 Tax=Gluconacetobacter diazotrophicus TaxID=33996 RepID=UPI001FCD64B7|nr:hypothetical protein [Gluconacetobacter diazotrophicus]